jgi:hypothetical protein
LNRRYIGSNHAPRQPHHQTSGIIMAEKSPEEIAEKRIEEARRTGATELRLNSLGLTVLPESIGMGHYRRKETKILMPVTH